LLFAPATFDPKNKNSIMFYVYIAYNEENSLRFIGTTTDMERRMKVHCLMLKNETCKLVYYEVFDDSREASNREAQLKTFAPEVLQILVNENNPLLINLLENN